MKRILAVLLLFGMALSGCAEQGTRRQVFLMDTVVELQAYGAGSEEAIDRAVERLQELEGMFSPSDENSEIERLNRAADSAAAAVSADLENVLRQGISLTEETGGAFDISLGRLIDLWDIKGEHPAVPEEDAIEQALQAAGIENVALEGGKAALTAGVKLHVGGIAKGYAANQVAELLRQAGVTSALFSIGGSIGAIGQSPGNKPWRVGIRDPDGSASSYIGTLPLRDQIVAVSGDYERFFEQDGVRYHHILDASTGAPARSGLRSVSVLCSDGAQADALSTALFVMGKERALAFWRAHRDFECVLVEEGRRVTVTQGIAEEFALTDARYTCETAAW